MPTLTGFAPVPIRGPRALPFVGVQVNLFRLFTSPITTATQLHREYGDIVALADKSPAVVLAFGARHNHDVLSNQAVFDNDDDFLLASPPGSGLSKLNKGLPFQTGDHHRRHRRLMMPAFHKTAIDGYARDIVAVADDVLETWPVGQVADVASLTRDLVRHVAMKCLFGLDWHTGDRGLGNAADLTLELLASPLSLALPFRFPGSTYGRLLDSSEHLVSLVAQLIAEKRRAGADGRELLSLIIHARDEHGDWLNDDELIGETNASFFAGYDTQAKTLAWTLFLLAQEPATAAALLDETESVLRGGLPGVESVPKMPYLDRVVKESMRIIPAVPLLFIRRCMTEAKLGGYTLPKNANVILSSYITHRDPERYSQPDRFLPDRWEKLHVTPYEYMPYGTGPRMCIGAGFATMALRLLLPMIHQRYRLTVAHGANISAVFRGQVMGPKFGLPMLIAPQDRRFARREGVRGDIADIVTLS